MGNLISLLCNTLLCSLCRAYVPFYLPIITKLNKKNLHVTGGGITDQVETSRIKEVTTFEVLLTPVNLA